MKKIVGIVVVLGILGLSQAGCSSTAVKIWPAQSVNDSVNESIKSVGGNPSDWVEKNNCNDMGICQATLVLKKYPGTVFATNIYVVKDSRPLLTHSDTIEMAVKRAVQRKCLQRFQTLPPLRKCINRGA